MAVDGTYNITTHTPMGAQASKLTLKVDGNSLSGQSEDPMGVTAFTGGTVNGNEFTFTMSPKTPMGVLKLELVGKVDGDKISGTASSMFGPAPFEGTRA